MNSKQNKYKGNEVPALYNIEYTQGCKIKKYVINLYIFIINNYTKYIKY